MKRFTASDKNTGKTDWNGDEDLKMNKFNRRIERLEEKLGVKQGPRDVLITNVDFTDGQEDPYTVELFPGLWACAIGGGPFTEEEIRNRREENKADYESSET